MATVVSGGQHLDLLEWVVLIGGTAAIVFVSWNWNELKSTFRAFYPKKKRQRR